VKYKCLSFYEKSPITLLRQKWKSSKLKGTEL
jgi:hypothetical protein